MTQNFRSRNLRGRSFKGQDLTGADFSHSDIRGADFTNATLIGANFSHTLAGLPPHRANLLIALSFLQLAVSGATSYFVSSFPPVVDLDPEFLKHDIAVPGVFVFVVLGVFFIVNSQRRLTAALVAGTVAVVGAVVVAGTAVVAPSLAAAVAGAVAWVMAGAIAGALPRVRTRSSWLVWGALAVVLVLALVKAGWFFAFACAVYAVLALQYAVDGAFNFMLAVDGALSFGLAWLFAIAWAFGWAIASSGLQAATSGALDWGVRVAVTIVVVVTVGLLSPYIAKLTLANSQKFAFIRPLTFGIATKDYTSFHGANLTDANFTQATLKNTNFSKGNLTGTNFANCYQLELALLDENISRIEQFTNNPGRAKGFLLFSLMLILLTVPSGVLGFKSYFQGKFSSHPIERINSLSSSLFLQRVLSRGSVPINSIAISPDGQFLASDSFKFSDRVALPQNAEGTSENLIQLWNLKTGRLFGTFSGYSKAIFSTVNSPNAQTLILSSKDKTIELWNLKTGQLFRTLSTTDEISSLAISDKAQILATAEGKTFELWNLKSGELLQTLSFSDRANSISISPDGQTLVSVTGSNQKAIEVWDLRTIRRRFTLAVHPWSGAIAISPDGQILVSTGEKANGTIKLWNLRTGQPLRTLSTRYSVTSTLAFSPDGQTVAGGGVGNRVHVWNVDTGELLCSFSGGVRFWQVRSVAFSPDGRILASSSVDGTIKIWRLPGH